MPLPRRFPSRPTGLAPPSRLLVERSQVHRSEASNGSDGFESRPTKRIGRNRPLLEAARQWDLDGDRALIGGIVTARLGILRALLVCGVLQSAGNLFYVVQAVTGHQLGYLALCVAAENLTGAMAGAALVAYLSSLGAAAAPK